MIVKFGFCILVVIQLFFVPDACSQEHFWPEINNWFYQLDAIKLSDIARSGYDLVVIDYSADGTDLEAFTQEQIDILRRKPDGSRRFVVCYLSIGEAEDYRYYWKERWLKTRPTWLDEENPEWEGNYKVRYWDKEWQKIIFGSMDSYLDKIIDAGFDGVYLDLIDAFEYYEDVRQSAAKEMIDFVTAIRHYARNIKGKKDFVIIAQNGERLMEYPEYKEIIDGIAKEDLYYGFEKSGVKTPEEEVKEAEGYLDSAIQNKKIVLLVEYDLQQQQRDEIYRKALNKGYIPFFSARDLNIFIPDEVYKHSGMKIFMPENLRKLRVGRFRNLTAPQGEIWYSASTEFLTERYFYLSTDYEPDDHDTATGTFPEETFKSHLYYEWTTSLSVFYGITDHLQAGLSVPVVMRYLRKDKSDHLTSLENSSSQTTIGNISVSLSYGRTFKNGDANFLATGEIFFPTDNADDPFFPGEGSAGLNFSGDRYWNKYGILGNLYLNYDFEGEEYTAEYRAGIGYQISDRTHLSFLAGGEYFITSQYEIDTRNILQIEGGFEYILSRNYSIDFNITWNLNGTEKTKIFLIEINF
jgi:cysteinyl-tRNA synthetase